MMRKEENKSRDLKDNPNKQISNKTMMVRSVLLKPYRIYIIQTILLNLKRERENADKIQKEKLRVFYYEFVIIQGRVNAGDEVMIYLVWLNVIVYTFSLSLSLSLSTMFACVVRVYAFVCVCTQASPDNDVCLINLTVACNLHTKYTYLQLLTHSLNFCFMFTFISCLFLYSLSFFNIYSLSLSFLFCCHPYKYFALSFIIH